MAQFLCIFTTNKNNKIMFDFDALVKETFTEVDRLFVKVDKKFSSLTKGFFTDRLTFGEDKDSYIIEAALPGFKKEDVKLTVKEGCIHVSAARTTGLKTAVDFSFPTEGDVKNAKASLEEGLLTIKVPKVAVKKEEEKTIKVN